jgi:hypothetical protein
MIYQTSLFVICEDRDTLLHKTAPLSALAGNAVLQLVRFRGGSHLVSKHI